MKNNLDLDEKTFEMIREEKMWNTVPRLNPAQFNSEILKIKVIKSIFLKV